MSILLLEDEEATALRVLGTLRARGHVLHWSDERHLLGPHEVAILGQTLCDPPAFAQSSARIASLRQHRPGMAIVMLCGTGSADHRTAGLRAGADACLPRDFDPAELVASIEALARRRAKAEGKKPATLRADDIEMDLLRREVTRAGRAIALMPQEFRVLEYLLRHRDRVVSKAMLLGAIERDETASHRSLIETHISRLRKKLNREAGTDAIETVRGAGYRIRIEA